MSRAPRLLAQLRDLRRTVILQRLLRAALRAAWLACAGLLAGWAIPVLSGTAFSSILVIAAAGLLSLIGILPIFWKWPSFEPFLWRVDRLLGLKEQVSTAWNASQVEPACALAPALQEDVLALLPGVRRRILRRGWMISGELISLLVVMVLGGAVYLGAVPADPLSQLVVAQAAQPPAFQAKEATRQEILPEGVLSLDTGEKPSGSQPSPTPTNPSVNPSQLGDLASTSQVLQQVGQQLGQQASSYELGQALQKQDFQGAADQLEQVADKLDSLSQGTRNQLAGAMSTAADALKGQKPAEQMANDLNQAANALKSGQTQTGRSPRDAMDTVANDLRDLSAQVSGAEALQSGSNNGTGADDGGGKGAGSGAGLGGGGPKQGSPSAMTRLQGESGDFKLDVNDPALAGILVPGPTTGTGSTVASGSIDQGGVTSGVTNQAVLFPYSYDWKWQGLIAQYFQRGR